MPATISREHAPEVTLWTDEEFLDWLQPGIHADLIGGERFMHSPVRLTHARLLNFLDALLRSYIDRKKLGELHREVVAVRLSARDVFLPDLSFFTTDQVCRLGEVYAAEAPTFVVEALSPSSASRDTGPKFAAYERHGVREYWIVDPIARDHHFFRREGELLIEYAVGEEIVRTESIPGFWLKRSWLDPAHLPEVAACLAEIVRA